MERSPRTVRPTGRPRAGSAQTPAAGGERLEEACRSLCRIVRLASARPLLTVVLSVLCAAGSVLYASRELAFMTSGRELLPRGEAYVRRDREIGQDFDETKQIVVVVEARQLATAKAYAHRLVRELRQYPDAIAHATHRIDPKQFEGRALLYLSTHELGNVRDKIVDHQTLLTSFAARPTLDQLIENVRRQVVSAFVSSVIDLGLDEGGKDVSLDVVRDLLGQLSARLEGPTTYHSPWGALFSVDSYGDDGYFVSEDKKLLFILVEPVDEEGSFTDDGAAIETLRKTIASLRKDFPLVQAGVTGAPALESDEMTAAFRDSQRATVLAFVLTLGVLLLGFRRIGRPALLLATLAVSLGWSIGLITLVVGHLSIFSVMFISIVIGIGIDYGVYFLYRAQEERHLGRDRREALETTAVRSGPGMLVGALTAAGTFYVLMATDFPGVQELGFIAGSAILMAWLGMMTLLPALIVLADRLRVPRRVASPPRTIQLARLGVPFVERVTAYPKVIMAGTAVLTLLSLLALRGIDFDYNLLRLQPTGTESVIWEERVLASAGRSSFAALTTAASLAALRQKVAAFERLGSVSEVDSVLKLIPDDQAAKRETIREFAPIVAPVRVAPPEPLDLDRLIGSLDTLRHRLDLAVGEAPPGPDRDEVVAVRDQAATLVAELEGSDRRVSVPVLARLQDRVRRDFVDTLRRLQRNLEPQPMRLADVPEELRRKFIGRSGRFLVEIHPAVDIWERVGAERFVTELRSVDPEVAGVPVISFEAIRHMERAYRQGTLYAFVLVALLSFLILRRLHETAFALLPLVLGTLWTVGLMRVFGLPFNLGNVFGFPLIIGAAAEFGLNVVLRYREGCELGGPLIARSTFVAVLMNGLTTIVGFGSLMIADHRGIFGLGLMLALGTVATLASSLVVLPVVLHWSRLRSSPSPMLAQEPSFRWTGTA